MRYLGVVVVLLAHSASGHAGEEETVRAVVAEPVFSKRQGYQGGWPMGLAGSTCPGDLTQCKGSISNPSCCPKGSGCYGIGAMHCCPDGVDCADYVNNFPQCADPNNILYVLDSKTGDYFCCPPGQVGVLPLSNYGGFCQPIGSTVAQSRLAVAASEAKVTISVTTTTTGLVTKTSTRADGIITTITTATVSRTVVAQVTNKFDATDVAVGGSGNTAPSQTSGTSASDTANNNNKASSGISGGAIAGIVIGALGVIAIAALAWVLYRRRKPAPNPNIGTGGVVGGNNPAPAYTGYQQPVYQQQDMTNYPIPVTQKSPALSQAAMSSTVGGQSPGQNVVSPQHGNNYHDGPPPPANVVEAPENWTGRSELGTGR